MKINERAWDVELIHDLFNEADRVAILSIPLSSTVDEDGWYWAFESSGVYSVKSAYRFLMGLRNQVFSSDNATGFWKQIWALKIPPKV